MLNELLKTILALFNFICLFLILIYSVIVMIPALPVIIILIIAYKIYVKITENDIMLDWNFVKMCYIVAITQ